MINEKETGVEFKTTKMLADGVLEGVPKDLPHRSGEMVAFVGASGSGKTTTALSWLTQKKPRLYRKRFDQVLVVMPQSSRDSIPGDPFGTLRIPAFDELTPETFTEIMALIEDCDGETLLILDDVAHALKDGEVMKMLRKLSFCRRHLKCTMWLIVQTLISLPLDGIRRNLTHVVVFRPRNGLDNRVLFAELIQQPRDVQEALVSHVWQEPHDAMLLAVEAQQYWRISRGSLRRLTLPR
jgi:ABC-type dipeptide/oligopeptide/nickel transport system ATPase component